MKVLLINNFHYRRGGSEAVYFNTGELLKAAGHKVVYFSQKCDSNEDDENASFFVDAERPGIRGKLVRILHYFNNREAAGNIEALIAKEHPDIAHVHLFWGGISASVIAVLHKHGIPIVHTAHDFRMVCPAYTFRDSEGKVCEKCKGGHFVECFKNRCSKGRMVDSLLMSLEMFYRNNKWHPAKELDGIIYVSNFSKRKHELMDPMFKEVTSTVLYNFSNMPEHHGKSGEEPDYYLYYGRLSQEKGLHTLVEAFGRHPELHLKIVGTGPLEKELRANRHDNIEMLGYLSGEPLFEVVRNARFVCVPSECYENNPMTIVEAYSVGVPVIGADLGGITEVVQNDVTGFLFESGSIDGLSDKLEVSKTLTADKYEGMRKSAKDFADRHFNSSVYLKNLMDFYNVILNKSKERWTDQ